MRVDETKVQILYEDGNDQGPHLHCWSATDEDPALMWKPAPPCDDLDVLKYGDWNSDIHPDLWNNTPLARKGERPRKSYPIKNDVRIDGFMSMSPLELFFQFLPKSFWEKVVTASNSHARKVPLHFIGVSFTLLNPSVERLRRSCTILVWSTDCWVWCFSTPLGVVFLEASPCVRCGLTTHW